MKDNASNPSENSISTNPSPYLSQLRMRRAAATPHMNEFWPMLNIKTSACPKCAHTFLRYAHSCPECGFATRRKMRGKSRKRALLCTVLAIVTTCFFVSEIPVAENSLLSVNRPRAAGTLSSQTHTRQTEENDKTRRILLLEADLEKARTGYAAKTK